MRTTQYLIQHGSAYTESKIQFAWISPTGVTHHTSFAMHRKMASEIIRMNGWESEFQKANKSRGYDAREFLLIVKGYVAISDGIPNWGTNNGITKKQVKAIGFDPVEEEAKWDMFFSD